MLILTRELQEGIAIGDDIFIKVVDIKSGAVKIAIDAPKDLRILRSELFEILKDSNQAAAQSHSSQDLTQVAQAIRKESPHG